MSSFSFANVFNAFSFVLHREESVVAALALCDKAGSFESSLLSRTFTNPLEVDFLVAVRFIPD